MTNPPASPPLSRVMADNERVVRLFSRYIEENPRLLDAKMVTKLASDCQVPTDEAFFHLLSAGLGLDGAENREDRAFERDYLRIGVQKRDPKRYEDDLYRRLIDFPVLRSARWETATATYAPYEIFACGHPIFTPDFREIPQIGYFDAEFSFPCIAEDGQEWMAVKPNEIETMREPIALARGDVLTLGLGLGYYALHASEREEVSSLTVVERDEAVIRLFKDHILPQFPHREKVKIVRADAFEYLESGMGGARYDEIFADLWHDASDGLPLYFRIRRAARKYPATHFSYWIEPSLLSLLRSMLYRKLKESGQIAKIAERDLKKILSDDFLQTLDPDKVGF